MHKDEIIDEVIADLSIHVYVRNGKLNIELKHLEKIICKDFVHLSDIQDDV